MDKIGHDHHVVDPFHTDFDGKLNYVTLGKHLLNSAENHAAARGFGMKTLNDANYTWVLSRLIIEMEEMPKVYEHFTLNTWIENIYRLFTNRNFSITGENGKVYGYARSIWAMINYENRQPVDLMQMHGDTMTQWFCPEEPCPIDKQGRVHPLSDEHLVRKLTMRYSDIDLNGHVNSIKYIEHICDLFPLEKYHVAQLKRIETAYMAETYVGDRLSFYLNEKEKDVFEVEIRKNTTDNGENGEPVVRSLLIFK